MTGFFLEQAGYNDEGLRMSLRALALDPTNLYTYHAVGHAYQARGDYRNALETLNVPLHSNIMRIFSGTWQKPRPSWVMSGSRVTTGPRPLRPCLCSSVLS